MVNEEKLDDFHYHEVIDRSSIILENFSEHVSSHVAVESNEKLKVLSEEILDKLYDFYCLSSSIADSDERAKTYTYNDGE